MNLKVAGVDEAGKGPVLGSMFVAGVMVEEDRLCELEGLGVVDSKALTPHKREVLAAEIRKIAEFHVLEVTARQIDELRGVMTMNQIVVLAFSRVLEALKPQRAYLDAADVDAGRFGELVRGKCGFPVEIVSEHRADQKYPLVAAASILAKTSRDESIQRLSRRIGVDLGSGYPSDPKTLRFLETCKDYPDFVRKTWETARRIKKKNGQRKIAEY